VGAGDSVEIAFHGAAGGVTGSCYLVAARGKRLLVDCGLFQGADAEQEGAGELGFDPRSVDYALLTHAHLDHCGRLPLLVRQGFRGEILATSATRDLARLVLLDAAQLAQEEAQRHARRQLRRGASAAGPAYEEMNVFDTLDRFGRPAMFMQPIQLDEGIRMTFGNAGHILGAGWVLLEIEDEDGRKRALFSGDLGMHEDPLLAPRAPAPAADVVVMETTYADRLHKPLGPSVEELRQAIRDTLDRGGNVVIPTFALERAQLILFFLRESIEHGQLPRHLNVYLDSPMAISATGVFRRHPECLNEEMRALFATEGDLFDFPGLHFARATADSMAINQMRSGAVILAGSGMATGGRVLHHLKHNLWRPESSVIFVGYAAAGTLARQIIDGQPEVRILGEEVHVAARVYTIGGFSAHADRDGLLDWYGTAGAPAHTFLVHGEDGGRQSLARTLRARGLRVELPTLHASYAV
jgi:metallo-beta-lactamase family protein